MDGMRDVSQSGGVAPGHMPGLAPTQAPKGIVRPGSGKPITGAQLSPSSASGATRSSSTVGQQRLSKEGAAASPSKPMLAKQPQDPTAELASLRVEKQQLRQQIASQRSPSPEQLKAQARVQSHLQAVEGRKRLMQDGTIATPHRAVLGAPTKPKAQQAAKKAAQQFPIKTTSTGKAAPIDRSGLREQIGEVRSKYLTLHDRLTTMKRNHDAAKSLPFSEQLKTSPLIFCDCPSQDKEIAGMRDELSRLETRIQGDPQLTKEVGRVAEALAQTAKVNHQLRIAQKESRAMQMGGMAKLSLEAADDSTIARSLHSAIDTLQSMKQLDPEGRNPTIQDSIRSLETTIRDKLKLSKKEQALERSMISGKKIATGTLGIGSDLPVASRVLAKAMALFRFERGQATQFVNINRVGQLISAVPKDAQKKLLAKGNDYEGFRSAFASYKKDRNSLPRRR